MKGKTFRKRVLSLMMVFAMLLSVVAAYVVPTETTLADTTSEYAAVVGDMSAIGVTSVSWDPASSSPRMDYLGNGYFYKEITFAETTEDKNIEFKIAFNGGWDKNIGFEGNNAATNIKVTVPAGTSSIEILANADAMRAYNSIQHASIIDNYLSTLGKVDKAPYGFAAIAGNVDTLAGSGFANWDPTGGNSGAGVMSYIGKGYYYKDITFDALTEAATVEFKAVFGGAWGAGDIGNNGQNYVLTIPAGATHVEVYADTTNWKIYTSLEHTDEITALWKEITGPYEIAAVAGNFDAFTGSGLNSWDPTGGSDGAGLMEYLEKGYYYKKISFEELTGAKTAEFKAVFGGDWGKDGDIGNNGGNYVLSIPAGSTYVEIIADTTAWKLYNSVEHATAVANILAGKAPDAGSEEEKPGDEEEKVIAVDNVQISIDGTKTDMLVYMNGVYEAKATLNSGSHTVQLYVNGETSGSEKTVAVTEDDTDVYFRLQNGELKNSVNSKMIHTAAFTGSLSGIKFVDANGEEYSIGEWAPADANAELDYIGGGLYKGTFVFKDTAAKTFEYKVAYDDAWNYSHGNGGSNIGVEVPEGTESITILCDEANGKVYDSVRTPSIVTSHNNNVQKTRNPYTLTINLAGSMNGWSGSVAGWEFTQIAETVYRFQTTLAAGSYEYKVVFDKTDWYEAGGNQAINVAEEQTVVFIYDAETEKIYNSVSHAEDILVVLGLIEAPAEMEVVDGDRGTTTFVAITDAGKEVTLYYGKKSEVEANGTSALKSVKMTEKADDKGVYVSEDFYFGDAALDYVFYYDVAGERTLDGAKETVTIGGKDYSNYTRPEFTGRKVNLPGSFPDKSWDAGSHQMTYVGNGLYKYTYENLPAAGYEYKVAIGGAWDPENYGANGALMGANMSVTVPVTQDVTFYYNDFSHYTVNSIDYVFADITLTGTGIDGSVKLTDNELKGIYSVAVDLSAGTYSNFKIAYDGKEYTVPSFTLTEAKTVNFYFDPMTCVYYHDASDKKVETEHIYYTTKDKAYKSIFGSVEQNKNVTFTIETGMDVASVSLVVKGLDGKTLTMEKGAAANGVQKWSVTTSFAKVGEYAYYFVLSNGSDIAVYGDDGSYAGVGKVCGLSDCTPYELVVHVEGFETPDWMKNAVIYQIFPDRFYNGNIENDKAQESARGEVDYEFVDDWYLLPENPEQEGLLTEEQYKEHGAFYGDGQWSNEIYGGDLEGIFERIDYLKALGVNVIYLNPIFASISNHRYDACDYTEIDPILGTLGDFEELVEVAEENGMKIILDGVFNHVSDDSIYFDRYYKFLGKSEKIGAYPYWAYVYDYMAENSVNQAAAEAAAKDYFTEEYGITDYSYTEWFEVYNQPMGSTVDNIGLRAGKTVYNYDGWWGYDSMPIIYSTNGSEFQTGNWAEEIIYNEDGTSVTQYWISKGNNGWRLDVANEVSDETWQEFRESVKALDSDAVIIGEIWDDATKYLMGDMYDSVMNYVFRNAVLGFANGDTATTAMETLEKIRERYPEEAFYAMMNLVGSHDTTRVLSFLDGIGDDRAQKDEASAFPTYEATSDAAKKRQYLVALMQFTYAGAPTIYYGDEIGMVGSDDPDDRRAMEWGKGNKELVTWYATLAAIRAQHDVLRTGSVEPIVVNDSVMGYVRRDADEVMIILVNNATSDKEVTINLAEINVDADTLTDLLTNEAATIAEGKLTVTVPAVNGVILSDTVKTYTVDQNNLAPAYDPAYIGGADLTPDEDPKPEPKPEEPKDENIAVEGSGIDKEDVTIAEDNKNNTVVKENGEEKVVIRNDKMPDLSIKGETDTLDKDAFFVRKYLVEGELFKETVAQMDKKLKEIEDFKVLEINLYSGEGVQITQLEDYVYVTIPMPTDITVAEGNVLVVYRVNDDGSFTNCNATVVNGEITFRTNHFSTFVIVEQAKTAVVPETGDNNMAGVYFFILLAGCAVAMAGVANRRKYVK